MLVQLFVQDYLLIRELVVNFSPDMTVLTGETGAGKSIVVNALSVAFGHRAPRDPVRVGAALAELRVTFSPRRLADSLCETHQVDKQGSLCVVRRVIFSSGKSKHFFNGAAISTQALKALGEGVFMLCGQHTAQDLLKSEEQRRLLDRFGGYSVLVEGMASAYAAWEASVQHLRSAQLRYSQGCERDAMTGPALEGLMALALVPGEYEALVAEFRQYRTLQHRLQCAEGIARLLGTASADGQGFLNIFRQVSLQIEQLLRLDPDAKGQIAGFGDLSYRLQASLDELQQYTGTLQLDPVRLSIVEKRIAQILKLSNVLGCAPERLYEAAEHHQMKQLSQEEQILALRELSNACQTSRDQAECWAKRLHQARLEAAARLAAEVREWREPLRLPHAIFTVELPAQETLTPQGYDPVNFCFQANPGQPMQALSQAISGGELSRMTLALYILLSQQGEGLSMIFDEIDTGLGGETAVVIGRLLKRLSRGQQLLCITHLAQIAAYADLHIGIEKRVAEQSTWIESVTLSGERRIQALAYMMSGEDHTEQALLHARSLFNQCYQEP